MLQRQTYGKLKSVQFICEYSIHILLVNKADSLPAETAALCRAATSENDSETGPTPEQSTNDADPRCTKTQTLSPGSCY